MNRFLIYFLLIALGVFAGAGAMRWWNGGEAADTATAEGKGEPLYWVAPMNPDYRRDEPGKSPMGMDLVPVYEEDAGDDNPGTVRVSPDVVNNLGVRTAEVARDVFDTEVRTVGYVAYDEDRLTHLHSRVEGWLEQLHVKAEGDPVERGEPVYEIYSPTLVNAQEELLLALDRGNRRLLTAAEQRLAALKVPAATIAALKRDRRVRRTVTVHAPQSGVVDNLNVREGMFVRPDLTMMSIGVLDEVWVVGEVFERQVSLIETGDPVTMTLDYLPGREWTGRVDYVYPDISEDTRTARVRMRLDNPDRALKPGMFAQLSIAARRGGETLLIPREALIRTGGAPRVVLARGDGRFKSVEVEAGRIGNDRVEVLSGLRAGERIVTSAQFLIDSESSKTSDFKRMHHEQAESERPESVWVEARVESAMAERRMATLQHQPVPAWDWPAMSMRFAIAESVDMDRLRPGVTLRVEIAAGQDGHRITAVSASDEPAGDAADADADSEEARRHQGDDDA